MRDATAIVTLAPPPGPQSVRSPTTGGVRPPSPTNGDGHGDPHASQPSFTAPSAARIAMLVFLAMETMLFAGFVAAFLVFRLGAPVWPPPFQPRLPLGVTALNAWVLLGSGVTMREAVVRAARGRVAEPVVADMAVFALYWYFVVGLWPVLYVLVYLV